MRRTLSCDHALFRVVDLGFTGPRGRGRGDVFTMTFRCGRCGEIVWPWQRQASFGAAGFRWWRALRRWHVECLVPPYSHVPEEWVSP